MRPVASLDTTAAGPMCYSRGHMSTRHEKYRRLIEAARALPPVTTAVAHPCDESSLSGALDAAKLTPIKPILVGPKAKIAAVADQFKLDISSHELVDASHSHAAAAKAVEVVRAGRAEALMKGSLHTLWLGVELDVQANAQHGPRISTPTSRTAAWVIPTNEELMIARHTHDLLAQS